MTITAMPKSPPAEGAGASVPAASEKKSKKSKKKIIVILLVLALGGGGYWMFRPTPPAPAKPGEVVTLDPIQINLASAHYLRLGLALQLTDTAHEADGSKALDAAISEFSGRNIAELTDPKKREKLKKDLEHELEERYHGDVMGVYFTEFVTQ